MASANGGCWEITGCDTKDGASVGCGYGCKALPSSCKSPCDCNGAWNTNSNGTITSVMDVSTTPPVLAVRTQRRLTQLDLLRLACGPAQGKCLQVRDTSVVDVATCTGKPNQQFTFKKSGKSYTVRQGNLCIQGAAPPAPPPTPCPKLETKTACASAVDKHGNPRCEWNSTTSHCELPPPPPPPQPCDEITVQKDCRWSNSPTLPKGRDCTWTDGKCSPPPAPAPLPSCAADHSCAHNGLSDVPPMGKSSLRNKIMSPSFNASAVKGAYTWLVLQAGAPGICSHSITTTQQCVP